MASGLAKGIMGEMEQDEWLYDRNCCRTIVWRQRVEQKAGVGSGGSTAYIHNIQRSYTVTQD
jgi:hypothetical protein